MASAVVNLEALPRTAAEALAQGANRFFTGRACKRGHVAARTLRGACVGCISERGAARPPSKRETVVATRVGLHLANCSKCGPESLYADSQCVTCGREWKPSVARPMLAISRT